MNKYIPKMYRKTIYDINYDKLKEMGIKCLIFDLDNTILEIDKFIPEKKVCKLIDKLKKEFKIYLISNNSHTDRIVPASKELGVDYINFALKPFSKGFRRVAKEGKFKKSEICNIGDQIMTDVLGGNRFGIFTILVEPLSTNELKVTGINRFFERRQLKKLAKRGLFKKGEYYE